MSVGKLRILRHLLIVTPAVILGLGLISIVWEIGVTYRVSVTRNSESSFWIVGESYGGEFALEFARMPKVLSDALIQTKSSTSAGWAGISCTMKRTPVVRIGYWPVTFWSQRQRMALPSAPGSAFAGPGSVTYPLEVARIQVQYWGLLFVTGIYPLALLLNLPHHKRLRRFNHGQCVACGYDLRHSPDRCPECGLPTVAVPPSSSTTAFIGSILSKKPGFWRSVILYPIGLTILIATFLRWHTNYYRK